MQNTNQIIQKELGRRTAPLATESLRTYFAQLDNPPAYTYDLIMLSIHSAGADMRGINESVSSAVHNGADGQQVRSAISRGLQLGHLDGL